MNKNFKKVARKIPLSGKVYRTTRNTLLKTRVQAEEIVRLRQTVSNLESRNEEWAREVRELRGDGKSYPLVWPVEKKDIIAAQWYKKTKKPHQPSAKFPLTLNWVIPPMGQGSGGHADIFRTIHFLENKGYKCRLYFYDALGTSSLKEIQNNLKYYAPIKSEVYYNQENMKDCDGIFATNWYTAYPVFNFKGNAKKYYYIQDFEPFFEPVGTYSTLAENTYKFGFRGLTLGKWLTKKLSTEYGMECDYFELGSEPKEYYLIDNPKPRNKILFYARPVTPRRGFELGILALERFHKKHPEYEIHFLGWDMDRYEIPFPFVDHGVLKTEQLNELYNECIAGLVLSFTNMSLLPLEMLSSGCIPVMNDAEHTRMVSYKDHLLYAEPTPEALAEELSKAVSVTKAQAEKQAQQASRYAQSFKWDDSNEKIDKILRKELIKS